VVPDRADAGRVIAGRARGIRLLAPGPGTRPLGDRVKETLFAILEPRLRGSTFLDLFAGSGAAGIEALSRGAARAIFVEHDAAALRTVERNLERTHLAGEGAGLVRADALQYLRGAARVDAPFDVVFVDPPYAESDLLRQSLELLAATGARRSLAPGATVVAKHSWRTPPPASVGLLASERERRFGETTLTFFGVVEPGDPAEA
jgi:16S rRNA (guanine966-N2)-methyltransferase